MEIKKRPVRFHDIVEFVNREAGIATNPVFGKISESAKTNMDSRSSKTGQNRSNASKPFSFAVQVNSDQDSNR